MPELPEVETVRRGLLSKLRGRKVTAVKVFRPDSVGHPSPRDFAAKLVGHKFVDIERRGKYLLFELDKGAQLGAHLRMSGRLLVMQPGGEAKSRVRAEHVRVRMELDDGNIFLFEDMRVFGRLWYVPKGIPAEKVVSGLADLGVEPLSDDFDADYLAEVLQRKSQPIKGALLDQTLIAGIGNIYADESLHLAGINPQRPARELKRAQLEVLTARIKEVLTRAIEKRGSTLRNYTDSDGVNGNYQSIANVYGRKGEKCNTCKTAIERVKLAGRSSHYCPKCQPASRARNQQGKQ
jgi:formamidopyrimidine-DNA glycosylase